MGSPRSSSSPTPTVSPTSKRVGASAPPGCAHQGCTIPRLRSCTCTAPPSVTPAFSGLIRATRAGGGVERAGQGKEGGPCRERTDVAQRQRGPWCHALFLARSGSCLPPSPSCGYLGHMKGPWHMWEYEMWELRRLVPDLDPGYPLTPSGTRRAEGSWSPAKTAAWVLPQERPSWAVGVAPFPTI